jgi:hypothetical protein
MQHHLFFFKAIAKMAKLKLISKMLKKTSLKLPPEKVQNKEQLTPVKSKLGLFVGHFFPRTSASIQKQRAIFHTYNVKNVNERTISPAGNPVMSLIKLFIEGNTSGISGFTGIFRDQEKYFLI